MVMFNICHHNAFASGFVVKQVLCFDEDFRCVLEEDGSEIMDDVMQAIFEASENVGVIMILRNGESWTAGTVCQALSFNNRRLSVTSISFGLL